MRVRFLPGALMVEGSLKWRLCNLYKKANPTDLERVSNQKRLVNIIECERTLALGGFSESVVDEYLPSKSDLLIKLFGERSKKAK